MKYNRTYHFPFSEGATNDDKIQHDWKGILQNEIVMTEKLDGENTCIKTDGFFARSHAAPTRNAWAQNMLPVWERVRHELGDLEVFGENLYGVHSIEYEKLPAYFFIFAIRENGFWLAWEDVKTYAALLDLPTVPVFKQQIFTEKTLQQTIAEGLQNGSAFGGECEGFVCRNANAFANDDFAFNVLKYVRANHVQTNEHWSRNWQRAKLEFEK